jgi:hypothetical protein
MKGLAPRLMSASLSAANTLNAPTCSAVSRAQLGLGIGVVGVAAATRQHGLSGRTGCLFLRNRLEQAVRLHDGIVAATRIEGLVDVDQLRHPGI